MRSDVSRRASLPSLALAAALASSTQAATHVWNGGAGFPFQPDAMNASANWSGAGVPSASPLAGSQPVLDVTSGYGLLDQNIAPILSVQSILLDSAHTFSGGTIRLANLGAAPTITQTNGNNTFNTAVQFANPTAVSVRGQLNFNAVVSGSATFSTATFGNVVVAGGGTNPGFSATVASPGITLSLNKPGAVGGSLIVNAGNVSPNVAFATTSATDIILNGGTFNSGTATQAVDNLFLNGGLLGLFNSNLEVSGSINASVSTNISAGNAQIDLTGAARAFNVASSSATLSLGAPLVNGSIIKTGPGRLTLGFFGNTYNATNVVNAGTLSGAPSEIGNVVVSAGAVVELSQVGTLSTNQITGAGDVNIASGVTYAVPQGYTGLTTLSGGSLEVTTATAPATINSVGGVLRFDQATNGTFAGTFSGTGAMDKVGAGTVSMGGTQTYSGGTGLFVGTLEVLTDAGLGSGTISVYGGNLQASGSRTLANPIAIVASAGFTGSGNFAFTNPAPKVVGTGVTLTHNSTGITDIAGSISVDNGANIVVNSGTLRLGNASVVNGYTGAGAITVNGGTLTLRSLNFISLPDVTLAGGTLNTPNGYAIPLGAVLQGTGGVTGRVASANGSSIFASGSLALGDVAHPAGVNLDGELYTAQHAVTLLDANQAVLGSFTQLGTSTQDGTLNAANGLVVNFGRNIAGRGTINSTNTLARAITINGEVSGVSFANPIDFTGYVKGVGTFNNVLFSGTFSPGLSPALLTVSTIGFGPTNILDMELGGLLRGGQYDAIDATGAIYLNGQLKLTLINSFVPALGNQFDLFNGTLIGTFSSFNFPPLSVGLVWDTSLLYTQGIVQVALVPEPTTLVAIGAGSLALLRRRRH